MYNLFQNGPKKMCLKKIQKKNEKIENVTTRKNIGSLISSTYLEYLFSIIFWKLLFFILKKIVGKKNIYKKIAKKK